MEDNLLKLYESFKDKADFGDFETFSTKMSDATNRQKFYDSFSGEADFGDYNMFEQKLGFGEKKNLLPKNESNFASDGPSTGNNQEIFNQVPDTVGVSDSNTGIQTQFQQDVAFSTDQVDKTQERINSIPEVEGKLLLDPDAHFAKSGADPTNIAYREDAAERSQLATVQLKQEKSKFLGEDLKKATEAAAFEVEQKFGYDAIGRRDEIVAEWDELDERTDISEVERKALKKALADENNRILESPEYKQYEKYALAQVENYEQFKKIIEEYPEAKEKIEFRKERQAQADRDRKWALEAGTLGEWLYSGNEAAKTLGRAGASGVAGLATLARTLKNAAGMNDYGIIDELAYVTEDYMEDINQGVPRATSLQRGLYENTVEFEGKLVVLDDKGEVQSVREVGKENEAFVVPDSFLEAEDKDEKTFVDRFNESGLKSEAQSGFTGRNVLLAKSSDGLANLAVQISYMKGLNKSLGITSKSSGLAKNASTITSTAIMVHRDAFNEAVAAGLAPDEAGRYAVGLSLATGSIATMFGLEKQLAGIGKTKIPKLNASTAKAAMGKVSVGKRIADTVKSTITEGLKEGIIEEGILENAAENLMKMAYSTENVEMKQVTFDQAKEDAIIGMIVGGLAGGGLNTKSKVAYQQEALFAATQNPTRFAELVEADQGLTESQKKENIDRINTIKTKYDNIVQVSDKEMSNEESIQLTNLLDVKQGLVDSASKVDVPALKENINQKIAEVDNQIGEVLGITPKVEGKQIVAESTPNQETNEETPVTQETVETTTQENIQNQENQEPVENINQTTPTNEVGTENKTVPTLVEEQTVETTPLSPLSEGLFAETKVDSKKINKKLDEVVTRITKERTEAEEMKKMATQGKRVPVEEVAQAGEGRASEVVLDKSTNPTEIAEAWRGELNTAVENDQTNEGKIANAIKGRVFTEGAVAGMIDTKQSEFKKYKGIKIVKNKTAKNKAISDLTEIAEELGVSNNEIEDFLNKYTFGGDIYSPEANDTQKGLQDKFKKLTGKKLTPELADQLGIIEEQFYKDKELFGDAPKAKEIDPSKKKQRGFEKRSIRKAKKDNSAKEVVAKIAEKSPGYYEVIGLKGLASEAVKEIDEAGGIEAAYDGVMNENIPLSSLPLVQAKRQVIMQGLGFKMAKAIESDNQKEIDRLFDKLINLKNLIAKTGTETGQASAALGMWRYLTPESEIADMQIAIKRGNDVLLDEIFEGNVNLREHVAKLEARIKELYTSLVNEQNKKGTKSGQNKKSSTKAKIEKLKGDRAKIKKQFVGSIFAASSGAPLTGDAIKYGSKLAMSYIQEGILRIPELRAKIRDFFKKEHDADLNDSHLDAIQKELLKDKKLSIENGVLVPTDPDVEFGEKFDSGVQSSTGLTAAKTKAFDKKFKKAVKEILGGMMSDELYNQIKDSLIKNGDVKGLHTKGAFARRFGLKPELSSAEQKVLHRLLSNLHNAKGQQQRTRAEKEFLEKLGEMQPTTLAKVADMFMSQFYTFVLSGPSTLARAGKGALITTGLETMVNLFESPKASIYALKYTFGRNGLWAGATQVPDILRYGHSDLDYRDKAPRADDWINKTVNKTYAEISKSDKSIPKKSLDAALKTALQLPVTMYRGLIAVDAILKHGLIEHNAFIEQYNLELMNGNKRDADFLNQINEKLGYANEAVFEQQAKDEISEMKNDNRWGDQNEYRYVRSRVKELLQEHRTDEVQEKSNEMALRTLLMNEPTGSLGEVYRAVSRGLLTKEGDSIGSILFKTGMRTLFPFLRVPTNFVNMALDYGPVGAIRGIRESKLGQRLPDSLRRRDSLGNPAKYDPRETTKQFIRSAIGTTTAMLLYATLFGGDEKDELKDFRVTGSGKTDWNENMTIDGGYQTTSIQWKKDKSKGWTKDNTSTINYVDNPIGMMLFSFGAITDQILDGNEEKVIKEKGIGQTILNAAQFSYSQSYSQGIKDLERLASAFGGDEEKLKRETSKFVAKRASAVLMPNLYKQAGKYYNAYYDIPKKKDETMFEMVVKGSPGFESFINGTDRDVLGLPKVDEFRPPLIPDLLIDVLKDSSANQKAKHPEWKLLLKFPEVTMKEYYPPRKFEYKSDGVKEKTSLDEKQYNDLRNIYKDNLLEMIREDLDDMNDIEDPKELQKSLNKIRSKALKQAKKDLIEKHFNGKESIF